MPTITINLDMLIEVLSQGLEQSRDLQNLYIMAIKADEYVYEKWDASLSPKL